MTTISAIELNARVLDELELLEWSVGDDPDTCRRIATAADAGTGGREHDHRP